MVVLLPENADWKVFPVESVVSFVTTQDPED
jgi:hypothetical protein